MLAVGDFDDAAAILQEFVTRVPGQIAALLKLVEICVDGGLEADDVRGAGAARRRLSRRGAGGRSARDRRRSRRPRAVGARATSTASAARW